MSTADRLFNRVIPHSEALWKRAGQEPTEVEIEPGHIARVVDFDIGIDKITEHKPQPFVDERGITIGKHIRHSIITSEGVDLEAMATLLDDRYQTGGEFFVSDSTAWFTDVDGYAAARDNEISATARVSHIRTGAEGTGHILPGPLEVLRLGATMIRSRKSTLVKSAQTDQAVVAKLAHRYSLPLLQYGVGDSQAGMRKFGAHHFAAKNGIPMGYMDIKAICAANKIELRDMPRVGKWFATEIIGGAAIVASMFLEDEAEDIEDTVSFNPNFIAAAIIGGTQSVAGGEAGVTAEWLPYDAMGHIVHYGKDGLAEHEVWKNILQNHPNIHHKVVPKGIHAHLLRRAAHTPQQERVVRYGEQLKLVRDYKAVDPLYVRGAESNKTQLKIASAS